MLKPRYIEELPEAMIALYSQVEMDILADMARRINTYDYYIPSAQWQQRKLAAMGNYHSFVTKALASRTAMTEAEIERLMEEAGAKAIAFDDAVYQRMGLHPPPLAASPALLATLEAGKRNTKGLFQNLCRTTANQSGKQFTNALDRAYLQILSGAFDRNTAVKMAVKNLAKEGVEAVEYPSGRRDTLEVAVRRAVVTGVNQTCLKLQEMRADEMGCDLVETTAHGGARPDHAKWQGKVFSRSGTSRKYEDFAEVTGYGTGAGLGGWNCRHSFYPYYEGDSPTYTKDMLDDYQAKKYTYNGEQLTEYEASQKQRYIERQIRRWKRENVTMNAAEQDTAESASKIAYWQGKQRDFIKQTGLKRQYDRERVQKVVTGGQNSGIIESNNMYRKNKEKTIEPMPKAQLQRIVKGFKRNGGMIQMDAETDAYLISKQAEAITYNAQTILLRQKPGRASVFEEIIHATQYRLGENDGTYISRLNCEILAQEKLIKYQKAYKLTRDEVEQTKSALKSYQKELALYLKKGGV